MAIYHSVRWYLNDVSSQCFPYSSHHGQEPFFTEGVYCINSKIYLHLGMEMLRCAMQLAQQYSINLFCKWHWLSSILFGANPKQAQQKSKWRRLQQWHCQLQRHILWGKPPGISLLLALVWISWRSRCLGSELAVVSVSQNASLFKSYFLFLNFFKKHFKLCI